MFDLDLIEQDWKNNSFRLSEEEIIEIYRSEGVTKKEYNYQMEQYIKKIKGYSANLTPEEKLIRSVFHQEEYQKETEEIQKKRKEVPEPKKKHLSEESQRKVVEGSLYIVFDATRGWYKFFNEEISLEVIYYICLNSLMKSTKYMLHNEKPVFQFYVTKSIESAIIEYISRHIHMSYREVYRIINSCLDSNQNDNMYPDGFFEKINNLVENKEEPEKPSKIFYLLKDEQYDVDYTKEISSAKFLKDYQQALDNLDDISRQVMELSYTTDGECGFTSKEIGEFLGIDSKKVINIKRKALKRLSEDERIKAYKL